MWPSGSRTHIWPISMLVRPDSARALTTPVWVPWREARYARVEHPQRLVETQPTVSPAAPLPPAVLPDAPGYPTPRDALAAMGNAIAQNDAFPFNFESRPTTLSMSISLPIFTGFSRERQVSQANNVAEDAEYDRRAEVRWRTDDDIGLV